MQELLLATGGSGGGYYPNSGPGPKTIEIGSIEAGFFGAVSKDLLLTEKVFEALTADTEYVDLNEGSNVWYKFAYKGRFLYMPKRPIAIDLTHPALYQSGMTHPDIDAIVYPYTGLQVVQDAKIVVSESGKDHTLSVRLPRTLTDDDDIYIQAATLPAIASANVKLSELHNTLIRLIGGVGDGADFDVAPYADTLPNGIVNNTKANVLCAEVHLSKNNLVNRRYAAPPGVGDFLATGIYSKKNGSNDIMYRPILEYLQDTTPLQTVKKLEVRSVVSIAVSPIVELSTDELVMPLMLKRDQPNWHALGVFDLSTMPLPQLALAQNRDQGNLPIISSISWEGPVDVNLMFGTIWIPPNIELSKDLSTISFGPNAGQEWIKAWGIEHRLPISDSYYFELKIEKHNSAVLNLCIGVAPANIGGGGNAGDAGRLQYFNDGRKRSNGVYADYGTSFGVGDVVGVGISKAGVEFFLNGVSQGIAFNLNMGLAYEPHICHYANTGTDEAVLVSPKRATFLPAGYKHWRA